MLMKIKLEKLDQIGTDILNSEYAKTELDQNSIDELMNIILKSKEVSEFFGCEYCYMEDDELFKIYEEYHEIMKIK